MRLSNSKIFLICCLAFIVGIFAGRFLNFTIMVIAAMVFIMIISLGWQKRLAMVIGFAGLISLLGAWRFISEFQQNDIQMFYGQTVSGQGIIAEEPDTRPDKVYLTLSQVEIGDQKITSKILATVPLYPQHEYGEKINFSAKIQEPKEFPDFNYKNYLSRFGIDAVIYYPKVTTEDGNYGNKLKFYILQFKHRWSDNLAQLLPEPQNAFLGGLLLGAKRAIPPELTDGFNITGTSHIVAVSGYNITIIIAGIDLLLRRFLHKRAALIISLSAIAGFVVLTGASASVIRAASMGALLLIALNIGRIYAVANALAFSAAVMLLINPQILHFDIGFQLSFAALLGLVYLTPRIEPGFLWVPKYFRQYLVATLAAEIATLPILLLNFGRLSLVAPLANILVLPVVPITMLFGFLAGTGSLVWLKLGIPFAGIAWILLTYIIKVVETLSKIPYAALSLKFNIFWFVVYYLILALLLSWQSGQISRFLLKFRRINR